MSAAARPHREDRGSALLLAIFFLVLLFLLASAFLALVPSELHAAQRHLNDTSAFYAADAGVVDTIEWLEQEVEAGTLDSHFSMGSGNPFVRSGTLDNWEWEVEIHPDSLTFGSTSALVPNPLHIYRLEVTASLWERDYCRVEAWVTQASFADKAYFVDRMPTNLWLNLATLDIEGDYHTNGTLMMSVPGGFYNQPTDPPFKGKVTFAEKTDHPTLGFVDGARYNSWTNLPYDAQAVPIDGRYEKLVAGGRSRMVYASEPIEMPPNSGVIATAAWGSTAPPPGSVTQGEFALPIHSPSGSPNPVKVRVNPSATGGPYPTLENGIYVEGNLQQMRLEVNNNNSRVRLKQSNQEVWVTLVTNTLTIPAGRKVNGIVETTPIVLQGKDVNPSSPNYTVLEDRKNGEFLVYEKTTNGTIFCTGDILGLSGVNKGRRTIATLTDTGPSSNLDREIFIDGSITRTDTTPGQTPTSADDMLGLISYAVRISGTTTPARSATNATNPLWFYASIFTGRDGDTSSSMVTGGGFGVEGYQSGAPGYMKVYGSIAEGFRQAKGTFNPSTGATVTGMAYEYHYEPMLKKVQPPFWPALPGFRMLTWYEESIYR
ncbi:MAG: hypothetical protein HY319_16575 [Armatimonadetes bacterium]|nr:hypothetical protein [Armatimonadota bacterium]